MGYYSTFTITTDKPLTTATVVGPIEEMDRGLVVAEWLKATLDYSDVYRQDDGSVVVSEVEWYDALIDLMDLSKQFPDVLFCCERVGEDGERWMIYARDGRSEEVGAVITYPKPSWL